MMVELQIDNKNSGYDTVKTWIVPTNMSDLKRETFFRQLKLAMDSYEFFGVHPSGLEKEFIFSAHDFDTLMSVVEEKMALPIQPLATLQRTHDLHQEDIMLRNPEFGDCESGYRWSFRFVLTQWGEIVQL